MDHGLPILNAATATFECTYGRGCEGVCCQEAVRRSNRKNGSESTLILPRLLPLLRPEAQSVVRKRGYLSSRQRFGHPIARNAAGWCVFFNQAACCTSWAPTKETNFATSRRPFAVSDSAG